MKNYTEILNRVLIDFQFIEEAFKMYISYTDKIIQREVSSFFPYKSTRKDINKFTLGKLINKYSKVSNNTHLAKRARALTSERNRLAHQGFIFTYSEQKNEAFLKQQTANLEETHIEATELLGELIQELKNLEESISK